jgi:hypothetical protein
LDEAAVKRRLMICISWNGRIVRETADPVIFINDEGERVQLVGQRSLDFHGTGIPGAGECCGAMGI